MSWPVTLLVAYVLFGIELALKHPLALGDDIAPSFVIPLVVFVALHTGATATLWTALLVGIVMDLTSPRGGGIAAPVIVVGPHAIGLLIAAAVCLQLRTTMIRRHPLTLIMLTLIAAAITQTTVVVILTIRASYPGSLADPFQWPLSEQLLSRLYSSLYTAAAAALLVPILFPLTPAFRFKDHHGHRYER